MGYAELLSAARKAVAASYAPYSGFHVGAALLSEDGTIFTGVNVENRSYGLTICAERSAVVAAVSAGHRRFAAVAVYSPDSDRPTPPCGACRQVLSEFMEGDAAVILADRHGNEETHSVAEILPYDSLHELKRRSSG